MLRDTVLLKFMAILLCARLVMSPTDSATVLEGGIGARGLGRLWRKKGTKVEVEVEGEGEGEGMMAQVGRRDRAMSRVNLVMGQASSVSSGSNKVQSNTIVGRTRQRRRPQISITTINEA